MLLKYKKPTLDTTPCAFKDNAKVNLCFVGDGKTARRIYEAIRKALNDED